MPHANVSTLPSEINGSAAAVAAFDAARCAFLRDWLIFLQDARPNRAMAMHEALSTAATLLHMAQIVTPAQTGK